MIWAVRPIIHYRSRRQWVLQQSSDNSLLCSTFTQLYRQVDNKSNDHESECRVDSRVDRQLYTETPHADNSQGGAEKQKR